MISPLPPTLRDLSFTDRLADLAPALSSSASFCWNAVLDLFGVCSTQRALGAEAPDGPRLRLSAEPIPFSSARKLIAESG